MPVVNNQSLQRRVQLEATVATPSTSYKFMNEKWHLVESLRGGTDEMRKQKRTYLPQNPKESDEAYNNRLHKTFLYNLYWRTITSITGLAFVKPVVVSNVPEALQYLEFNFDGTGRNLTEVAYDLTIDAIHYGKAHAMMDFPQVDTENMSLGEFRNSEGIRPYVTQINPRNLIGWRTEQGPGIPNLKQARIIESTIAPSDYNQWADKEIFFVRVFNEGSTDIYKYDPEMADVGYDFVETVNTTLPYIPIATAYSNKTGYFEAEPALYDLAQTNISHWQSTSEQNNILHVARVPFLNASGYSEGELENVEIGPNRMVVSSNPDARIRFVEHSGHGIGAGRQHLMDLEKQMATLGADMLVSKGVDRMTATARRLDQNESMSTLQMSLKSVEQVIQQLYEIAGDWLGIDASGVSVSVGDDLSIANEPNPTNALVTLLETGLLTDSQVVEEAKRQGILSSYFTLSEERPRAQEGFGEEPDQEDGQEEPEEADDQDEDDQESENEDEEES